MIKNYLKILFCIIFFLISCSNNKNFRTPEKIPPLHKLYSEAYKLYEKGEWFESIELFKKFERNYSFSEWAPKSLLMVIYMYYESNNILDALENANKFKKLYPVHKDIPYVEYIIGLLYYEQINLASKDQTNDLLAAKQFKKIQNNYPNSSYAEDVKLKLELINEQLAAKHIYLARYYMKKSKWLAAIKRLNIVLDEFQQTIYVKEALHRLVEIYYKLGNVEKSKKYASILGYNFNESDWYKKSYEIVTKDYKKEKENQKKLYLLRNILKFENSK